MPRSISSIVACIDVSTQTEQKLCTLQPSFERSIMQGGVSSSLDFVDIFAVVDSPDDSYIRRTNAFDTCASAVRA